MDLEFRLADLKGKKVYANKTINIYKSSKDAKPFRKVLRGDLIGVLDSYSFDISSVNPTQPKTLKNTKIWFVFKDSQGKKYGFLFIPNSNQINLQKFVEQGVKTEQQYHEENVSAYNKSPIDALTESVSDKSKQLFKQFAPFIVIGLAILIYTKRK